MFRKGIDTRDKFVEYITGRFDKAEKKGKLIKELAITDAYALKSNTHKGYEHPLILLNRCIINVKELNKVTLLVNKNHLDYKTSTLACEVLNEMFVENSVQRIDVIFDLDFHDRFWFINKKKAFIVGASLNALGGKHFFVQDNYFKRKDVKVLLDLCFNADNFDAAGNLRTQWCYEKQDGNWVDMTK